MLFVHILCQSLLLHILCQSLLQACCNHFGPVHQIKDDNSEGDMPLVAMSAGLSLVGTYLKHIPSCAFISFNRLVIHAGNGFAVCIQCSTH